MFRRSKPLEIGEIVWKEVTIRCDVCGREMSMQVPEKQVIIFNHVRCIECEKWVSR